MSKFRNAQTGVVVSVDDSKDARFADGGWETADEPKRASRAKKSDDKS